MAGRAQCYSSWKGFLRLRHGWDLKINLKPSVQNIKTNTVQRLYDTIFINITLQGVV